MCPQIIFTQICLITFWNSLPVILPRDNAVSVLHIFSPDSSVYITSQFICPSFYHGTMLYLYCESSHQKAVFANIQVSLPVILPRDNAVSVYHNIWITASPCYSEASAASVHHNIWLIASPCYRETNAASVHNNIWLNCLAMLPRDKVPHLHCKSSHQITVFTYFTVCRSYILIRSTSMVARKQHNAHLCTIVPHCSKLQYQTSGRRNLYVT